jgi:hypothetical protein
MIKVWADACETGLFDRFGTRLSVFILCDVFLRLRLREIRSLEQQAADEEE